jgi:chemotaxis protein MotB
MSRRKKHPDKAPNHERWLVSYGDFITLMFAVFVTLYAMSQTDKNKVEALVASLRESFGYVKTGASSEQMNIVESTDLRTIPTVRPEILTPGLRNTPNASLHAEDKEFREIKAAIETHLVKKGAQDKVNVDITQRGLVVSLKEAGFFDSGSAVVKPSSYPLLAMVAESISRYYNPIRVEGNTDNVPISSRLFPSNWELSTGRATNIVHYLINAHQFNPARVSAVGYGEYRPMADNSTPAGRSKNRRVDIVLLSKENEGGEAKAEPSPPPPAAP